MLVKTRIQQQCFLLTAVFWGKRHLLSLLIFHALVSHVEKKRNNEPQIDKTFFTFLPHFKELKWALSSNDNVLCPKVFPSYQRKRQCSSSIHSIHLPHKSAMI